MLLDLDEANDRRFFSKLYGYRVDDGNRLALSISVGVCRYMGTCALRLRDAQR